MTLPETRSSPNPVGDEGAKHTHQSSDSEPFSRRIKNTEQCEPKSTTKQNRQGEEKNGEQITRVKIIGIHADCFPVG